MQTDQALDLGRYHEGYIETFLQAYDGFVAGAQELATLWLEMDEEERVLQRAAILSDWDKRYVLGALYRAGRLTLAQEVRLTDLDRALLEEAAHVKVAYGASLRELMEDLLAWGTPLTEKEGSVRLEVPLRTLPAFAQALAMVGK